MFVVLWGIKQSYEVYDEGRKNVALLEVGLHVIVDGGRGTEA